MDSPKSFLRFGPIWRKFLIDWFLIKKRVLTQPLPNEIKITGNSNNPHGGLFENGGLFVKIGFRGGGLFGTGGYSGVGA